MTIFITGATGFIGSHLCRALLDRGHHLRALVRSTVKAAPLRHPRLELFEGDLSDEQVMTEAMNGCDAAFHLAAYAKVWAPDPALYFDLNVLGTETVMRLALRQGIKKIVLTSTAGVWGPSLRGSVTEVRSRDMNFLNEYESSKALADSRAKDFLVDGGIEAVFVHPTRVYGPYLIGESGSISSLIERYLFSRWRIIPGRGDQIGNYVYIDDVVEGHIRALEMGRNGRSYILGGPNATYNEFFETLSRVSGIERRMIHLPLGVQHAFARLQLFAARRLRQEPVLTPAWMGKSLYHWEVNPSRMEELGLHPTDLETGLARTVEYMRRLRGRT